jgi:LmbE family N-acetylglucosaminyl deacetylase
VLPLSLQTGTRPIKLLCLGAHSDDLEIGCGGALLRWLREYDAVDVTWAVFSAGAERGVEARRSARALLRGAHELDIVLGDFDDTRVAADFARAQAFTRNLARRVEPDVVLTHRLEDRHQDHRLVAELTWQTFRDHLILEYEIPKYEGDLGQPNLYVPVSEAIAARKVRHLLAHFGSQRAKGWFRESTFRGLMALRGIECRADSGLAEAFHVRKAVV